MHNVILYCIKVFYFVWLNNLVFILCKYYFPQLFYVANNSIVISTVKCINCFLFVWWLAFVIAHNVCNPWRRCNVYNPCESVVVDPFCLSDIVDDSRNGFVLDFKEIEVSSNRKLGQLCMQIKPFMSSWNESPRVCW